MFLSTAKEEIRARLQELSPDFWTNPEVVRAVNEGVRRFSAEEKWDWLFTVREGILLEAEDVVLDLEEGVKPTRHFNVLVTFEGDERPRQVRRVQPAEGTRLRTIYYTTSAEPMCYYLSSQVGDEGEFTPTIHFVPALNRDALVEYQYIRDPVAVVGDGDELDVPEEYAMGPVAWATGSLFLKELQYSSKAQEQFGLYQKVVDDAKRESRRLTIDSGFAWGRNEPEIESMDERDWVTMRIPPTLGP